VDVTPEGMKRLDETVGNASGLGFMEAESPDELAADVFDPSDARRTGDRLCDYLLNAGDTPADKLLVAAFVHEFATEDGPYSVPFGIAGLLLELDILAATRLTEARADGAFGEIVQALNSPSRPNYQMILAHHVLLSPGAGAVYGQRWDDVVAKATELYATRGFTWPDGV
jgi:hypothetical protein